MSELEKLNHKLDLHISDHDRCKAEYLERYAAIDKQQAENTKAIADLTKATEGLVTAWNAANAMQRFVKWFSGFALIGAVISWFTGINPFKG